MDLRQAQLGDVRVLQVVPYQWLSCVCVWCFHSIRAELWLCFFNMLNCVSFFCEYVSSSDDEKRHRYQKRHCHLNSSHGIKFQIIQLFRNIISVFQIIFWTGVFSSSDRQQLQSTFLLERLLKKNRLENKITSIRNWWEAIGGLICKLSNLRLYFFGSRNHMFNFVDFNVLYWP